MDLRDEYMPMKALNPFELSIMTATGKPLINST